MRITGKQRGDKQPPEPHEVMALTLTRYAVKSQAQVRYLRERLADVSNLILTRWLFLRLLALMYLIAFCSFWLQCDALIGPEGILPAAETLDRVQAMADRSGKGLFHAVRRFPTLCWLGEGYASPVLCLVGVVASLIVLTGFAQPVGFLIMWACYLSVSRMGWAFAGGAGDQLLLEAGFLAIFFAPFVWEEHTSHEPRPSELILFLYRWLLFRVVLGAALAKFGSGDGLWYPSFTALTQYYQSQPLPTPVAWYLHHLPPTLHQMGASLLMGAEIMCALVIFASRRIRVYGAIGIAATQLLILLSGNFGILNWLTIVLAVLLLDDEILPIRWRGKWCVGTPLVRPSSLRLLRSAAQVSLCACVLSVSIARLIRQLEGAVRQDIGQALFVGPSTLLRLGETLGTFGIVGSYGMPIQVSSERLALVVEGSHDATDWKPYEFAYHHGPVHRPPPWIAPFHPRLDWQLSRAAPGHLSDLKLQRWFLPLMACLLEGNDTVHALLAANPFPDQPPRYLRVWVYRYSFTTGSERRSTGDWWRRDQLRAYCPQVTLRQLQAYLEQMPDLDDMPALPPEPPPAEAPPAREERRPPPREERRPPPPADDDGFVRE